MSKQELIDKAVERLNGKPMQDGDENVFITPYDDFVTLKGGYKPSLGGDFVCAVSELKKRARELGWINGYKYGVEYETNGKKPDLAGDVAIKVKGKMINGNEYAYTFNPDAVDWFDAISFRIVDERYKPVDDEQVQADNSLKVGEQVGFPSGCGVVAIADEDKDGVIIVMADSGEYRRVARAVIERKADEEKRKFVERGLDICGYDAREPALIALYDAGCQFTENKAAS